MSSRREARERVMQGLYAFTLGGGDVPHILNTLVKPRLNEDAATMKFAETLLLRTLDIADEADALIGRHADNWDLSRIALIDRSLSARFRAHRSNSPSAPRAEGPDAGLASYRAQCCTKLQDS